MRDPAGRRSSVPYPPHDHFGDKGQQCTRYHQADLREFSIHALHGFLQAVHAVLREPHPCHQRVLPVAVIYVPPQLFLEFFIHPGPSALKVPTTSKPPQQARPHTGSPKQTLSSPQNPPHHRPLPPFRRRGIVPRHPAKHSGRHKKREISRHRSPAPRSPNSQTHPRSRLSSKHNASALRLRPGNSSARSPSRSRLWADTPLAPSHKVQAVLSP